MKKILVWIKFIIPKIKIIVLAVSVCIGWAIILGDSSKYEDDAIFRAIPFTILTIYVWNRLNKNTDNK